MLSLVGLLLLMFHAALHVAYQIQLQMGFGFPNPVAASSGSVCIFP